MFDKDKYISELQTINSALVHKLDDLKKRQMTKNGDAALKWRGRAFYYKRKCQALTTAIGHYGLEYKKGVIL